MDGKKSLFQSKTVLAGVVSALCGLYLSIRLVLKALSIDLPDLPVNFSGQILALADSISALGTIVSGILAVFFRIKADTKIG